MNTSQPSREYRTVLGLDPGGTTGFAFLRLFRDRSMRWGDVGGVAAIDFFPWLSTNLDDVDFVCCESFKINPHVQKWNATRLVANSGPVFRQIGAIEFVCWQESIPLSFNDPIEKSFAYSLIPLPYPPTNKKLSHQTDAMCHARLFVRKKWNV